MQMIDISETDQGSIPTVECFKKSNSILKPAWVRFFNRRENYSDAYITM